MRFNIEGVKRKCKEKFVKQDSEKYDFLAATYLTLDQIKLEIEQKDTTDIFKQIEELERGKRN